MMSTAIKSGFWFYHRAVIGGLGLGVYRWLAWRLMLARATRRSRKLLELDDAILRDVGLTRGSLTDREWIAQAVIDGRFRRRR